MQRHTHYWQISWNLDGMPAGLMSIIIVMQTGTLCGTLGTLVVCNRHTQFPVLW